VPMLSRRNFLLGASTAALASAANARRPNIVWFMYDDLGSAELGCFGQKRIRTPHSDRLAREGMRLTACYAGGSVCAPSRSVLMTGLHLGHTPVRANAMTVPLEPGDVTVAEILKEAGYATGGFGKWGLGDAGTTGTPQKQGFDEFFGYLHQTHAHNYWPEYLRDGDEKVPLPENVGRKMGTYSADLIANRMYRFLEKNRSRPFFLYATPTLPHAEFHPPNEGEYANEPWTHFQKKYAAMVSQADAQLGKVLQMLDDFGLASNTIVFCTSDNGGPKQRDASANAFFETNGGLRDFKGSLWEGGIRVPMIVRWPGHVVPGTVNATPCYFADFLPTAVDLVGARKRRVDGMSLLPVLTGKKLQERFLYWEQERFNNRDRKWVPDTLEQAARSGDWKAVRLRGGELQLFDLAKDPSEKNDVAAANPKVVARFEAFLKSARVAPRPHDNGNSEWNGRQDMPLVKETQ
jgi:arylsulfatase A-like enzyme